MKVTNISRSIQLLYWVFLLNNEVYIGKAEKFRHSIVLTNSGAVTTGKIYIKHSSLSKNLNYAQERSKFEGLNRHRINFQKYSSNVVENLLASTALIVERKMSFIEHMIAGAISRSTAQTMMQPFNVMKTLKQAHGTANQLKALNFQVLTRGAGAQFLLSLPHGAIAFGILEWTKKTLTNICPPSWSQSGGFVFDFIASAVSTTLCSVVSTPQMVITDRIMAGRYPHLVHAVSAIFKSDGLRGFYSGWFPALAQKIPSYGMTWVFYQMAKDWHSNTFHREATDTENFLLGAFAAGATVCLMIPLDTVKTRIVTQPAASANFVPYTNMANCFVRIFKEEGIGAFYSSLPPRLASVVPMIGIQFQIYEAVKKALIQNDMDTTITTIKEKKNVLLKSLTHFQPKEQKVEKIEQMISQEEFLETIEEASSQ
mmetsp:Transcript_37720/g.48061  ORF Transcript_37720/g.48061 Transcript_37720/m.48061 type:complete len:427 (-) Transcript_37720:260-1540(-)